MHQIDGFSQPGNLGEHLCHGAAGYQFAAAVVRPDDRSAEGSGVKGGGSVVGDHGIGRNQEGGPFLVWSGQGQPR